MFTIPLKQVADGMFGCKTVTDNIVSINLKTSRNRILPILDQTGNTMVSSPQPSVINNSIATVDLDHHLGLHFILIRSTNSSIHIAHGTWILRISSVSLVTPLQKGGSFSSSGL